MTSPTSSNRLKRRKSRRNKRQFNWRSERVARWLCAILAIFGLVLIVNPLQWIIAIPAEPEKLLLSANFAQRLSYWLIFDQGSLILGIICVLIALCWGAWLGRNAINDRRSLYATACPNCGESCLKRTRRHRVDHLINRVGVPVRRYVCPDCNWHGQRIDHTQLYR